MDIPEIGTNPEAPAALPPEAPSRKPGKSPGVALMLSVLMPGIGQIYNGQPAKAFVFFFGMVGSIYGAAEINPLPFAFLIPFAYFYNLVDAYRSAALLSSGQAGQAAEDELVESPGWGASLIVLGLVLLMHNLGWLDLAAIGRYWPLLLVAVGALFLYGAVRPRKGVGDGSRL
jgi:TM2 domain-containing membrane protein YozV